MDTKPTNQSERRIYWLAIAKNNPPEWLASYIETPQSKFAIVTENGPTIKKERNSAYLENWQDAPYWAFALAKSYMDDVGEWPLAGIATELTLTHYEEQLDQNGETGQAIAEQAVRNILLTVQAVWPELEVIFVGEEKT
ncbi:MAG: hypothetical protein HQL71_08160 [Magnetococcales bacterium]|nr:hypothetical protein [Magnetococcales bacterium]